MPDALAKGYLYKFYFRKMFLYLKKHTIIYIIMTSKYYFKQKIIEEKPQFQRLWKAQHTDKALNKIVFLVLVICTVL